MTSVTHCGRQKKNFFLRLQRRRCPGSCDRDPGPFTKKRKKKRERKKKGEQQLLTFVKNDLIAKNNSFKFAMLNEFV